MRCIMKNVKIDRNFTEYILFDTDKAIQTRIVEPPEAAKDFANGLNIKFVSPAEVMGFGGFNYKHVKLSDF